jgi:hypothetical protein
MKRAGPNVPVDPYPRLPEQLQLHIRRELADQFAGAGVDQRDGRAGQGETDAPVFVGIVGVGEGTGGKRSEDAG